MRAEIGVGTVQGVLNLPTSKSLAHRALLCAALAGGESRIEALDDSEDIRATKAALTALGAAAEETESGLCVSGREPFGQSGPLTVDCGESGSTLRFLIPLLALSGRPITLKGHGRLMQRPLGPYEEIFKARGLPFALCENTLQFSGPLASGEYQLPGDVSSQFITGLLLALPLLDGDSVIRITRPLESAGYVTLTRQVQAAFGVVSRMEEGRIFVPGNQRYKARNYRVPADDSQAAFPAVLSAVKGGLSMQGPAPDSAQPDAAIFEILERCGAVITRNAQRVTVQPGPLTAAEIDLSGCPDLGPVLMVLGMFCKGTTHIYNAGRLRLKESDRIAAMQTELEKFGARITSDADTVTITGGPLHAPELLWGHGDHRVVMALTVAAFAAGLPAQIEGAEAVCKSWPDFFENLADLGAPVRIFPEKT